MSDESPGYVGQPLGPDEVVGEVRTPHGVKKVVITRSVAEQLRVGREVMKRRRDVLAALAKS